MRTEKRHANQRGPLRNPNEGGEVFFFSISGAGSVPSVTPKPRKPKAGTQRQRPMRPTGIRNASAASLSRRTAQASHELPLLLCLSLASLLSSWSSSSNVPRFFAAAQGESRGDEERRRPEVKGWHAQGERSGESDDGMAHGEADRHWCDVANLRAPAVPQSRRAARGGEGGGGGGGAGTW